MLAPDLQQLTGKITEAHIVDTIKSIHYKAKESQNLQHVSDFFCPVIFHVFVKTNLADT